MPSTIGDILCWVNNDSNRDDVLKKASALALRPSAKIYVCENCLPDGSAEEPETSLPADRHEVLFLQGLNPAKEVISEAAKRRVDLILLNTCPNAKTDLLGDYTVGTLLREAPCAVLAARPEGPCGARWPVRRILVAYDFSDYSEAALQKAVMLALMFKAELDILHVLPRRSATGADPGRKPLRADLYHEMTERLNALSAVERMRGITGLRSVVRWGRPYAEILNYAEENDVDLISMGSHGSDFGRRSIFGSNVERVSRQADCAVLIDRPLYRGSSLGLDSTTETPKSRARSNSG